MNRKIFCVYWLYFYGARGLFEGMRMLDYIAMSLVVLGLVGLVITKKLNLGLVAWITMLCSPLILAVFFDSSLDSIFFVLKTYVLALYFACYFKSMRITRVELVCFAIPFVVSLYVFIYPGDSGVSMALEGRMSGISEPNFTSLSLIYSICGAAGIYIITKTKRVKFAAMLIMFVCFCGVILTASRGGFIGVTIALCLFLIFIKKWRYVGLVAILAAIMIALNGGVAFQNAPLVVERFLNPVGGPDTVIDSGRDSLLALAWVDINQGDWLISGGPQRVTEWATGALVPHNSLLDIGLAYGKASFYFYSALLAVLLVLNVWVVAKNWPGKSKKDKFILLAPMLFLSLLPMYMSLSAGFAMDFILWMVLGAYPLLRPFPRRVKRSIKCRHIALSHCAGSL